MQMRSPIPFSTTYTQTITSEEGSQSIETGPFRNINNYNFKSFNTISTKNKRLYSSKPELQSLKLLSSENTINTTNRSNYKNFQTKPGFKSILTNNYLRSKALMRPESGLPIANWYLDLNSLYYNSHERTTFYTKKDLMDHFFTKNYGNFNNKYMKLGPAKRNELFNNIRSDTSRDSMRSSFKKSKYKNHNENMKLFSRNNELYREKDSIYRNIRPLSHRKVSIKLMKMLQNKG